MSLFGGRDLSYDAMMLETVTEEKKPTILSSLIYKDNHEGDKQVPE